MTSQKHTHGKTLTVCEGDLSRDGASWAAEKPGTGGFFKSLDMRTSVTSAKDLTYCADMLRR